MRGTVLFSLLCLLASALAFIPISPICKNGASKVVVRSTSTAPPAGRRGGNKRPGLSMGFEGWLEKATDTRYARVRHILVDEKGEEGRARLQEVKDEVAGDLDKFSEVAEKISTCTSAPKGGRLKLLARGETVPEFDEIAFTKELGVVHGPVETAFGTHLIYVETCNKPENTWKNLFNDVVKKVKGDE